MLHIISNMSRINVFILPVTLQWICGRGLTLPLYEVIVSSKNLLTGCYVQTFVNGFIKKCFVICLSPLTWHYNARCGRVPSLQQLTILLLVYCLFKVLSPINECSPTFFRTFPLWCCYVQRAVQICLKCSQNKWGATPRFQQFWDLRIAHYEQNTSCN